MMENDADVIPLQSLDYGKPDHCLAEKELASAAAFNLDAHHELELRKRLPNTLSRDLGILQQLSATAAAGLQSGFGPLSDL